MNLSVASQNCGRSTDAYLGPDLLHKQHLFLVNMLTCFQSINVNPGGQCFCIEGYLVEASILLPVDQIFNLVCP